MNTIELLQAALQCAESLGYGIRHEWLGGAAGGACEIAGKKWLFVDLALGPIEQLEQVAESLRGDASIYSLRIPPELQDYLGIRRVA